MKKGFTLIELLAVIVILAIISLIAVPIVINIINDSKKSSEEQSVELYMDSVKKAIARKQLENTSFNPDKCDILENGNILCNNIEVTIDIEGMKPNKGIIEIKDNKLTYKNLLLNKKWYNKLAISTQDNNNNGKPDIGDKYTYKANDTDIFNFYVLSFNDDDTVNLIMDRNICNDGTINYTSKNNYCTYAWNSGNNTYGPATAMQELYNATKDWNNVPDIIINYIDESNKDSDTNGYNSITTDVNTNITTIIGKPTSKVTKLGTSEKPLKARLPKVKETTDVGCKASSNGVGACPAWLVINLKYYQTTEDKYSVNKDIEEIQNISGYWLMASHPGVTYYSRRILNNGYLGCTGTNFSNSDGVRPVITVPKDYLE